MAESVLILYIIYTSSMYHRHLRVFLALLHILTFLLIALSSKDGFTHKAFMRETSVWNPDLRESVNYKY